MTQTGECSLKNREIEWPVAAKAQEESVLMHYGEQAKLPTEDTLRRVLEDYDNPLRLLGQRLRSSLCFSHRLLTASFSDAVSRCPSDQVLDPDLRGLRREAQLRGKKLS